jgi:hypothetical protein
LSSFGQGNPFADDTESSASSDEEARDKDKVKAHEKKWKKDEKMRKEQDRITRFMNRYGLKSFLVRVAAGTVALSLLFYIASKVVSGTLLRYYLYRASLTCSMFGVMGASAVAMHCKAWYGNYSVEQRKYLWAGSAAVVFSFGVTYTYGVAGRSIYSKTIPLVCLVVSVTALFLGGWLFSRRQRETPYRKKVLMFYASVFGLSFPLSGLLGYARLTPEEINSYEFLKATLGFLVAILTIGILLLFGAQFHGMHRMVSHMKRSGRAFMGTLYAFSLVPSIAMNFAYLDPSFVEYQGGRNGQDIAIVWFIMSILFMALNIAVAHPRILNLIGSHKKARGVISLGGVFILTIPFFIPLPYFEGLFRRSLLGDLIKSIAFLAFLEMLLIVVIVAAIRRNKKAQMKMDAMMHELMKDDESDLNSDSSDESNSSDGSDSSDSSYSSRKQSRTFRTVKKCTFAIFSFLKSPKLTIKRAINKIVERLVKLMNMNGSEFTKRWKTPSLLYAGAFAPSFCLMVSLLVFERFWNTLEPFANFLFFICIFVCAISAALITFFPLIWNRQYRRELPAKYQRYLAFIYSISVFSGPTLEYLYASPVDRLGYSLGACVFLSFCIFPILYNYEVKHLGGVEKMAVYSTLVLVVFPGMLLETFCLMTPTFLEKTALMWLGHLFSTMGILYMGGLLSWYRLRSLFPILRASYPEKERAIQLLQADIKDIAELQHQMATKRDGIVSKSSHLEKDIEMLIKGHTETLQRVDTTSAMLSECMETASAAMLKVEKRRETKLDTMKLFTELLNRKTNVSQEKLRKGVGWIKEKDEELADAILSAKACCCKLALAIKRQDINSLQIKREVARAKLHQFEVKYISAQSSVERAGTLEPSVDNMQLLYKNTRLCDAAKRKLDAAKSVTETVALEHRLCMDILNSMIVEYGTESLRKKLDFATTALELSQGRLRVIENMRNKVAEKEKLAVVRYYNDMILTFKDEVSHRKVVQDSCRKELQSWSQFYDNLKAAEKLTKALMSRKPESELKLMKTEYDKSKSGLLSSQLFNFFRIEDRLEKVKADISKSETTLQKNETRTAALESEDTSTLSPNEIHLRKLREKRYLKDEVDSKETIKSLRIVQEALEKQLKKEIRSVEEKAFLQITSMFLTAKPPQFENVHTFGAASWLHDSILESTRANWKLHQLELVNVQARRSNMMDSKTPISVKEKVEVSKLLKTCTESEKTHGQIFYFTNDYLKQNLNLNPVLLLEELMSIFDNLKKDIRDRKRSEEERRKLEEQFENIPEKKRDQSNIVRRRNLVEKERYAMKSLASGIKVLRQAEANVDNHRSLKNARVANEIQARDKLKEDDAELYQNQMNSTNRIVKVFKYIRDICVHALGGENLPMLYVISFLGFVFPIVSLVLLEVAKPVFNFRVRVQTEVSRLFIYLVFSGVSVLTFLFVYAKFLKQYKQWRKAVFIVALSIFICQGSSLSATYCTVFSCETLTEKYFSWLSCFQAMAPLYLSTVLTLAHYGIRMEVKLLIVTLLCGILPIINFLPSVDAFLRSENRTKEDEVAFYTNLLFLVNVPLLGIVQWLLILFVNRTSKLQEAPSEAKADGITEEEEVSPKAETKQHSEQTPLDLFLILIFCFVIPTGGFLPYHLVDVYVLNAVGLYDVTRPSLAGTVMGLGIGVIFLFRRNRCGKKKFNQLYAIFKKDPNTGAWIAHGSTALLLPIGFFIAVVVSMEQRRPGLMVAMASGGLVHTYGNFGMELKKIQYTKLFLCVCCLLPMVAGISMTVLFMDADDDTFLSIGMALMTVWPGATIFWAFLWQVDSFFKSRKNGEFIVSGIMTLCCCLCLIPFGFVVPVITSMDFKGDVSVSSALRVTVSVMSLLCMAIIIVASNVATSTFLSLEKERMAKKVVRKMIADIKDVYNLVANETLLRPLFDIMYDITDDKLDEFLVIDNPVVTIFDDSKCMKMIGTKEFKAKKVNLCKTCLAGPDVSHSRAEKRKDFCRPCQIERILEEKREHRRSLELEKYASEEKKALIRLQRQREKQKQIEMKKKERMMHATCKQKLSGSEFEEVVKISRKLVEMNSHDARYCTSLATGLYATRKYEEALRVATDATELSELSAEPVIIVFGSACLSNDPTTAIIAMQKRLKTTPNALPIKKALQLANALKENQDSIRNHGKGGFCRKRESIHALSEKGVTLRAKVDELVWNILFASQRRRQRRIDKRTAEKAIKEAEAITSRQTVIVAVNILNISKNVPKSKKGIFPNVYCTIDMEELFISDVRLSTDDYDIMEDNPRSLRLHTTKILPAGSYEWPAELVSLKHWMFSGHKKLVFRAWIQPREDEMEEYETEKSRLIGQWSVASFQITRYVRERVYAEVPLKKGHGDLGLSEMFGTKKKASKRRNNNANFPKLGLAFNALTENELVRYVRKKYSGETLEVSFNGWKALCGNSSDMVLSTLQEAFVQYALRYPYVPRHVEKKKKKKKMSVKHLMGINHVENLKTEIEENKRKEQYWHDKILTFYEDLNPAKATSDHVRKLLNRNKLRERELFERLHSKYQEDLPDDHVKAATISNQKKQKLSTRRAKIVSTPGAISQCLISTKGIMVLLREASLNANVEGILKSIYTRKLKYEEKRRGGKLKAKPAKACNFKMFLIALYECYINHYGTHVRQTPKMVIATEICYRHIRRHCPMYARWRTQRRFIRERVRDIKAFFRSELQDAKKRHRFTTSVRRLQRNFRKKNKKKVAVERIVKFFRRLVTFSKEAVALQKKREKEEHENDESDDEESDEEVEEEAEELGKSNSLCEKVLERLMGQKNEEKNPELEQAETKETVEEGTNIKKVVRQIQKESVDISVARIVVANKKATVHFQFKSEDFLVSGQSLILSNVNQGGTLKGRKRINGEWPTKKTGKEKGKRGINIFHVLEVDEDSEFVTFETEGIPPGIYTCDPAYLPQTTYPGIMITVRKSVDSVLEQTKNEKKEHRISWAPFANLINSITLTAREAARKNTGNQNDITVNWKATENVMAVYNMYVGRFMTYIALAMTNGPLAESESRNIGTVSSLQKNGTTASPESPGSSGPVSPSDYLEILVHIPQMKLPAKYGNTYQYFLILAIVMAAVFPPFTSRAIRRARKGTMGLGPDGRRAGTFTKEGIYMLALNIVSNTFYFGVMITLVSAFACEFDTRTMEFYLSADHGIECFSYSDPTHFVYMVVAGAAVFLFYPLATILIPTFQFMNKGLDIKFTASFVTLEKQTDLGVAIFATFYSSLSTYAVLFTQLLVCLGLAGFNHATAPCLVSYMNIYKTIMYVGAAYITAVIIFYQYSRSAIITYALVGVGPVALGIFWSRRRAKLATLAAHMPSTKVLPIEDIKKNNNKGSTPNQTKVASLRDASSTILSGQRNAAGLPSDAKAEISIPCPQCRVSNLKSTWHYTFVKAECCICLEVERMVISANCGHGMCKSCFDML